MLLGIDVDQLDDPVAVGAAGGGKQMRGDLSRDDDRFGERIGDVGAHVGTPVHEPLIFDQPRRPAAAERDRPRAIGHRAVRI